MLWLQRLSLSTRVAAAATLVFACASALLVWAALGAEQRFMRQAGEQLGRPLITQLAATAAAPLLQEDYLSLQAMLKELVAGSGVRYGAIYDLEHRPLAEAGVAGDSRWAWTAQITWEDQVAGYAVIEVEAPTPNLWQLLLLALLFSAGIGALSALATRRLEQYLEALRLHLQQPQSSLPPWSPNDALGRLRAAVVAQAVSAEGPALLEVGFEDATRPGADGASDTRELIASVCRLYNGSVAGEWATGMQLRFSSRGEQGAEDGFHAVCCAALLHQLEGGRLRLMLRSGGESRPLVDTTAADGPLLSARFRRRPGIESRARLEDCGDYCLLLEVLPPYRRLLESQAATLASQFNRALGKSAQ